jgi:co-chaperonin GroES (HSP10)
MTKTAVNAAVKITQPATVGNLAALADAFPSVDPGVRPYGSRVLVQIRRAKQYRELAGGKRLYLTEDTKETEKWNTQVAKVVAVGPVAFRNRTTLQAWPEGDWALPGTFCRVPKYGGDRWEVPIEGQDGNPALFAVFNDLDLVGEVTGDPLAMKAFI